MAAFQTHPQAILLSVFADSTTHPEARPSSVSFSRAPRLARDPMRPSSASQAASTSPHGSQARHEAAPRGLPYGKTYSQALLAEHVISRRGLRSSSSTADAPAIGYESFLHPSPSATGVAPRRPSSEGRLPLRLLHERLPKKGLKRRPS